MKAKPKRRTSKLDVEGPNIRVAWNDTQSLTASWEIDERQKEAIEQRFAIPVSELPFVLRLYDVTDRMIKNDGLDSYVDFDINVQASNWLLYGIESTRQYCVELGVRMVDGRYYSLKRSDRILPYAG
ncbi:MULTISPECIES: DUF4912 domain-containing protein [Aneurinibacillus]|uniref:DUF4912 domain-containing protein n=1 Tax=Aneurinibacillus thermoaerophilus TaxID=143495 RepID=A0A1G7W8E0_ANETH|nr:MULTISPECIES: DUF4912 domain-containing protein [Aneurinibacillus]AMA72534.1 hypothetical protein ACH33_06500 [Aneurinibacillus sp. XH2]MED0675573.1 DUF4912 domain-containing protein [Aneurinibacillus thermoaerophilus]MED0681316.1 DUF4912 domain-containing protein [Aneurinibacillus thermoaerophilus]MED0735474.1 DUF4912 domain-containing protein [Aneurinibacillus thermoaerophilus]MED0756642.1 DUF4912 domain-containing protein [Aneurinibacillus thermoaerophilus]